MAGDTLEGVQISQHHQPNKSYGATTNNDESIKQDQEEKENSWCDYVTDPRYWPYRSLLLLLQCYVYFVSYYCAESPGGLESTIIKVMNVDTTHYDLLLSVSAWPNVVLCLIGGVIVDRVLGQRVSYILVITTTTVGQFIWALGAFLNHFWLMLVGRFFIGLGAEMTDVVSTAFAAKWPNVTFLMSVFYTAARIGASSALAVPQFIYENLMFVNNPLYRLGITLLFGVGLMLIGIAVGIIVVIMDKREEEVLEREKMAMSMMRCSDLRKFPFSYWISVAMISIYCPVIFSFTGIGQVLYMQKFGLSLVDSGTANSLVFCATIIAAPLVGYLINVVGHHSSWTILGILSALASHITILTSNGQSYIPYLAGVIYSVSYTITIPSLYSIPGVIIDPSQTSTAYGFVHCSYNLVLSLLTVISGLLVDYAGYMILELLFCLLLYMMLIMSVVLWMTYSPSDKHEKTKPVLTTEET